MVAHSHQTLPLHADVERVLISRERIAARLDELAARIAGDWEAGGAGEVTLVPILTGSIVFVSDLIRRLPLRLRVHLISVTSYPGKATSSRGATLEVERSSLPASLEGRHVLVVDDIFDSGRTLELATRLLAGLEAASVRSCVLLDKRRPREVTLEPDYVAFEIPDEFIVGYGLDYDGYYRNLPDIVTLKRGVIDPAAEPG